MNRLASILLAACALVLSACSSFNRDWHAAQNPARFGDPVAGAWDGKWTSEKHRLPNGQPGGGRLRCIFTKKDANHYLARFRANWLFFVSGYEATFETKPSPGGIDFKGTQDLGFIFGGVYHYDGRVTPTRFLAHFSSGYDHGLFDMHRPAAGKAQ